MRVTQRSLDRYRNAVDQQANLARGFVSRSLDAYFAENERLTTADGRNFAIELLKTAMPNFCDAAGTLAADFFDEMAEAGGMDVSSQLYDMTDYSIVEDKVRYFAGKLNDGDVDAFKKDVSDATHYFVRRSAYDNMVENCKANQVRYARVPTGFETCAFCFMLASRGFVYHSETTAKGLHGIHPHCDCCIVPGKKGRTTIEGYDPRGMYDRWRKCAETVRLDPDTSDFDTRKAIMREVETRDWHWLYTGETPKATFENLSLEAEIRGKRPHELATGTRLTDNGVPAAFQVDVKHIRDAETGLTRNVGLPDLANGYELKTLNDAGWNSVDGYLRKTARSKEGVKAIVVDNFDNKGSLSDGELVSKLKSQQRWRGRIYVITRDGKYVRVL